MGDLPKPDNGIPGDTAVGALAHDDEAAALYSRAGVVTLFTLLSRMLGMVRDLVLANRFGASGATDAWVQAFRIPNALRRLTAEGAMTIAFVPIYVRVRSESGQAAAGIFARRVLGLVLLVTALPVLLGMLFAESLTGIFSPGFAADPAKFALAADLLRWCFPYLLLVSLVAWAMGVLNSEGRFAAPAAAPMLLNIGIITAVLGFSGQLETPILAVALGVLAGGVAQVLLQMPALGAVGRGAVGQSLLPMLPWGDPAIRRLLTLLAPALFGVAVYELNIIVLGVIASYLPTGQIFHYNNATRLSEVVMGVFAFAFSTVGLPTLSKHRTQQDWRRMGDTLRTTFSATQYAILPAAAGLAVAGQGIVAMLYLHGAYTWPDVASTADALTLLALGMPAVAAVRVFVPVYYAFEDARTPVLVSAATLVVTGLLGWVLSSRYQVPGLAAGLSLGTWLQCLLLAAGLRRHARPLEPWVPWRSLLRQGGCALVMGLAVSAVHGLGDWSAGPRDLFNWLVLTLVVGGGASLYFLSTLALGEPQAGHWLRLAGRLSTRLSRNRLTADSQEDDPSHKDR